MIKIDHPDLNLHDLTTIFEMRIPDVLEQLLNRQILIRQIVDHRGNQQLLRESSTGHAQHALTWYGERVRLTNPLPIIYYNAQIIHHSV